MTSTAACTLPALDEQIDAELHPARTPAELEARYVWADHQDGLGDPAPGRGWSALSATHGS